ncbi:MAG TPA: DUF4870 domain-containing protein [Verrucomicrobiota bacterium]|nr:DUF4870 domain-containing protein [Verrucomicrobiales bacterium]HRI12928.1 DUF4870 domain-containing protein [Verrucomicrobiota bacterium]
MSDPNADLPGSDSLPPGPPPNPLPAAQPPPGPVTSTVGPARSWEVGCHVAAFSGFVTGIGWIIGPLIVWLLKREEYPSVDAHGKEELNFQLSVLLYQFCLLVGGLLTCGLTIPVLVVVGVAQLVLMIIASVQASSGVLYRYPLTIRFLS